MIFPRRARAIIGLKRAGLFRWNAADDDPQLLYRLRGRFRPRHLILVADAGDAWIEPTLYLDRGCGFNEQDTVPFPLSGRAVCWLELQHMPDIRGVRLDPATRPGPLRAFALTTPSRFLAQQLVRRLSRDRPGFAPTRVQRLANSQIDHAWFGWGRGERRFKSTAEHYGHVLAMRREAPVPDPFARPAPLVSFLVPTYETDPDHLDALLDSFLDQPAHLAELILSDDGSKSADTRAWLEEHASAPGVRVIFGERNEGIAAATNRALEQAVAPWISLVDHDDALSRGAMAQIARTIEGRPDAQFIYTDEVVTDGSLKPQSYMLKPAYDPVLLSGVNYINHLSIYRRKRLLAIGGFREGFQGSQDYDLILRYLDGIEPARVVHLPYPAYQWRRHGGSFSVEFKQVAVESARRALGARYAEAGRAAEIDAARLPDLHRVRFDRTMGRWPRISVIIPNRDSPGLMSTVLDGLARTDYPEIEIVVADNDSRDRETFRLYDRHKIWRHPFIVEPVPGPFNFSRSVNRGVARASGELLLLLNNDIEIREPDWLKEMASCFQYDGTGIVGARLLYPDGRLQHAGVIVGLAGLAGHWFGGKSDSFSGPMGRLAVRQSLSAVTGAAMLISRECLNATGRFDEESFPVAYNDIDFCLRARAEGFRTVWTPFATLIHHESASRGSDAVPGKIDRFRREQRNLRERHSTDAFCDPAYNPWYDRRGSDAGLHALDELPEPR